MLEDHGLQYRVLAFTRDNASPNDTQTDCLDKLPNSFNAENRIRCFNHTIQIAARALLKPFDNHAPNADDYATLEEADGVALETAGNDSGEEDDDDGNDVEDQQGDDPMDELEEEERQALLADTALVRSTLSKV
jgi:hypothetical protein